MNINQKRRNFFIIWKEDFYKTNDKKINTIVQIINKDRLAILSWLKNIWKINFIKELLSKTWVNNNYFYFNKSDDLENYISDSNSLEKLLNEYVHIYKKPNIVILQNIEKIEWIKDFLWKIYWEWHKILLVWNNIRIWWIKEVEIVNDYSSLLSNLNETTLYWSLNDIRSIDNYNIKKRILKTTTSDILLNEICNSFSVKNIELYYFTLSYLSNNTHSLSLRELQKNLDEINNISLKTLIDYVNFSMQTKIIKRVYKYDFKKAKAITSKATYYFTDNGIRNSFSNFELNNTILTENLVFNILEYNNYTVYSGLNWKFDFTFYIEKENIPLSNAHKDEEKEISLEKKYIHISKQTTKEEIKKEVNKLLKISKIWKKYLIVKSIEELGIKKTRYDSVEILEVEDFLKKFID